MKSKIEINKTAQLTGHKDSVYCLTQGKDDATFYSVGGDGFVIEWNLNDTSKGTLLTKLSNTIYTCHYDSFSEYLLVLQNNVGLHIIDPLNKKELKGIKLSGVSFFSVTATDSKIYVGSEIGEIYIIDKDTFEFQRFLVSDKSIRSLSVENDQLICGLSDHSIKVLNTETLVPKHNISNAHGKSVFTVQADSTHKQIISGGRDAHLKIWDSQTFKAIKDIPAHIYPINTIAFKPDKSVFVSGSMDKTIKLWDSQNHKLHKVIDNARHGGHTSSVNSLLWTSHKNQLISCSDDRTIIVWSINIIEE